jgi:hypothetical protein
MLRTASEKDSEAVLFIEGRMGKEKYCIKGVIRLYRKFFQKD